MYFVESKCVKILCVAECEPNDTPAADHFLRFCPVDYLPVTREPRRVAVPKQR